METRGGVKGFCKKVRAKSESGGEEGKGDQFRWVDVSCAHPARTIPFTRFVVNIPCRESEARKWESGAPTAGATEREGGCERAAVAGATGSLSARPG